MNPHEIVTVLKRFHNVVLEGVPGTGKTFAIDRVAEIWKAHTGRPLGGAGKGAWAITLHPNTAYEDFIEGLRPAGAKSDDQGEVPVVSGNQVRETKGWFFVPTAGSSDFEAQDGFFLRACVQAAKNPGSDFLILLDELNRANVPKVIGDLLTTLESSKRATWDSTHNAWQIESAAVVSLPYSGRPFFVPANLYVLATMNTSDRSVGSLDAALRRRFAFLRLDPMGEEKVRASLQASFPTAPMDEVGELLDPTLQAWHQLNHQVLLPCLGPDAMLGHSYLFGLGAALMQGQRAATDVQWRDNVDLDELRALMVKGETSDGEPIRRAFWMETGVTGASETAADLPKTSVGGTGGQPQLLLGMATPDEHREYILPLREPGEAPKPTVVKYWGGGRNNGMWRWQQLPSDVTNALVFLLEDAGGGLEYRVLEPSTIPLLQAVSRADKNIGGKRWGTIQLSQIEQTRCSELVRQTWRHELLPQLIDNLEAQGAELLLDPARRAEWFEGQPDLDQPGAEAGLKALDLLLVQLGLGITVKGTGVGRAPFIEELAAQPAEPAVIPEAGADA